MKQNKMKLTMVMAMIMVLSLTVFSVAYAAVYKPELFGSREENPTKGPAATNVNINQDSPESALGGESESDLPVYDAKALAVFNGKEDQPAYIAFEGLVYEVGKFTSWVGGFHNGYQAGEDLTDAFEDSPHAKSIFNKADVVGTYVDVMTETIVASTEEETVVVSDSMVAEAETLPATSKVSEVSNSLAEFNAETLSSYNGKNGQPAYIAFEGVVYEVGKFTSWVGGFHNGYQAGEDLTEAFKNSPHTRSIFDKAEVVGTYGQTVTETTVTSSQTTKTVTVPVPQEEAPTPQAVIPTASSSVQEASNPLPVYNAESLSLYNGKNGQPAYIAIDGVVYEVSGFVNWMGGWHHGYQAGADLTQAFGRSPHTKSILSGAAVVGTYSDVVVEVASQPITAGEETTVTQAGMTLAQLSHYTGQNGQPAYIAVNGVVYDVSSYWRSGQHQGLSAGSDMTRAFASSPHSQNLLNSLPVIGNLAQNEQVIDPAITTIPFDEYEDEYEHEDEYEEEHEEEYEDEYEEEDEDEYEEEEEEEEEDD